MNGVTVLAAPFQMAGHALLKFLYGLGLLGAGLLLLGLRWDK